jgi:hypothetical protein
MADKPGMFTYNKNFNNDTNDKHYNNNNNTTNNNKQLVPYNNPYHKKLNNIYNNDIFHENYDDTYVNSDDDNYDIDEVFGNRSKQIEGLNPGSDVITYFSLLDREASVLPCHAELEGKCSTPYTPSYDTPLRSITAEEGGQVSTPNISNTNNTQYYINDREGHVAFVEPSDRTMPELTGRDESRGQQYLTSEGDSFVAEIQQVEKLNPILFVNEVFINVIIINKYEIIVINIDEYNNILHTFHLKKSNGYPRKIFNPGILSFVTYNMIL